MKHLVILALALGSIGAGCSAPTPPGRPIMYHPQKTIASRLLPDDHEVFVQYPKGVCKMVVPGPETVAEEIELLRHSEAIAIVRVTDTQAELIENGAWVRTNISADIEQVLQSPPGSTLVGSLETGFPAGATKIGDVTVNAGVFPQYVPGERYLMFLYMQPGLNELQTVFALRVNAQGLLERMTTNAGAEYNFSTRLVGQNLSDIAAVLSK